MRRIELIALRPAALTWEHLTQLLPPALEAAGLAHDEGGRDGEITVLDHGEECVVIVDSATLAPRVALALARRASTAIDLFQVVGTRGEKRSRFRTAAWRATPEGELRDAEGKELDLEDPEQSWGGGGLEEQARRVLDEFAQLDVFALRTLALGYRRQAGARPSSPRIAALLATLKKAKSHVAATLPDSRVELRISLAAGGTQTSYCSAAELEELERLLGGGRA
jgi:hypothetical protein